MNKFLRIFPIVLLILAGCEDSTTNEVPMKGCSSTIAHIQVIDGMLIRLCGCAEANNTIFTSGQSLSCTVSAGTTLFFDFVGVTVSHQINVISVNATPIVTPNSKWPTQSYPIEMQNTGTFQFNDIFFPSLGGTITVN